ncbi:hypothetical protein B0H14DRAFT_2615985 [Mycena olivaceomarginata]|nr:hypothetical protein B0H14DRAFT_2615985 [Mycena olivaceomarginata]
MPSSWGFTQRGGDLDESPKAVAAGNAWKFEGNQGSAAANWNKGQDCAVLDRTVDLQIQGNQAGSRGRTKDEIASEVQNWFSEQPGKQNESSSQYRWSRSIPGYPPQVTAHNPAGCDQYIWHHMNTEKWSDADRHLLAIRLQSTDITGLTVPPIRAAYMIQYKNNLIGKHFKTLMQILAFHELCARLWVPEIDDMEDYLAEMKIAVANLLDAFDVIKLHLLAHTMDDIRRFGPLIQCSTEIYEAFNRVFRLCSVYSNHLAPSRDISRKFASMARVKHLLSGGYWWDSHSKQWVQAGEENGITPQLESLWRFGRSLSAQSGDSVVIKNWVVAKDLKGRQFLVLRRPNGSEIVNGVQSFLVLPSTSIQFVISIQHDCRIGHCQPAVVGKERQEHEDTSRDKSLIKHTDDDHFLINMGRAAGEAGRDARRKKTAAKRRQNAEAKRQEAEDAEWVAEEAEQAARDWRNLEDNADETDPDNSEKEDSDGPESEDEPEREDAEMKDGERQPEPQRGQKRRRVER